jgi:hypothetical protein
MKKMPHIKITSKAIMSLVVLCFLNTDQLTGPENRFCGENPTRRIIFFILQSLFSVSQALTLKKKEKLQKNSNLNSYHPDNRLRNPCPRATHIWVVSRRHIRQGL